MDNYFKPENLLEKSKECLYGESIECETCICGNLVTSNSINKYSTGLYNVIEQNDKSVKIIDRINNDDYDKLLSENIVFLNLVDCSAVNTVIECIVRNTVIILNRHIALEELLGSNYPGFYNTLIDATLLLNNHVIIEACHIYIKNLDKTKYHLDYFISEFQDVILKI
jgi:hypothetical protein